MARAKFKEAEKVGDASILKMAKGLNSALEQLYGSCALNPRKINTVMTWKTVFLNKRYVYKLFYGLGPELGGPPLPHLPEGVHRGTLLVVPQPRDARGEGAGGVLPVYELLRPQFVDLQGQVVQ